MTAQRNLVKSYYLDSVEKLDKLWTKVMRLTREYAEKRNVSLSKSLCLIQKIMNLLTDTRRLS